MKILSLAIILFLSFFLGSAFCNEGVDWFNKGFNSTDPTYEIECYTKALDSKIWNLNNKATIFNNISRSYSKLNEIDKAMYYINEAIGLNPQDSLFYHNRGHLFIDKENYSNAINDYTKAIKLDSKNPEYYHSRAEAYIFNGDEKKGFTDEKISKKLKYPNGEPKSDEPIAFQSYTDQTRQKIDTSKGKLGVLRQQEQSHVSKIQTSTTVNSVHGTRKEKLVKLVKKNSPVQTPAAVKKGNPKQTLAAVQKNQVRQSDGHLVSKKSYALQVGAYRVRLNAVEMKDSLIVKGYAARILTLTRPTAVVWYLVRIGNYARRDDAQKAVKLLTDKSNTFAIIRPFGLF